MDRLTREREVSGFSAWPLPSNDSFLDPRDCNKARAGQISCMGTEQGQRRSRGRRMRRRWQTGLHKEQWSQRWRGGGVGEQRLVIMFGILMSFENYLVSDSLNSCRIVQAVHLGHEAVSIFCQYVTWLSKLLIKSFPPSTCFRTIVPTKLIAQRAVFSFNFKRAQGAHYSE